MNSYMLAARKAIESQYDGKCNIIEHKEKLKENSNITHFVEEVVKADQPCKISFEEVYVNTETDTDTKVITKIKLFIAPEINISPGSKIIVTQKGRTTEYKNSGEPAVYDTHQEIMLVKFKGWA